MSAVHTFESLQSVSDVQQPAVVTVFEHVPVATLHVSVVQKLLSLQSRFVVQHPAPGVCTHWFVVVLHVSTVQELLSLHWEFWVQQPVIAVFTQVLLPSWQRSSVQTFESLQSAFVVQQFAIGVFTHVPGDPAERSQVSFVHAFRSLHWAFVVHVVAAWRTDPVSRPMSLLELHLSAPMASRAKNPDVNLFVI